MWGCGSVFLTQWVTLETQGKVKIVGADLSASMLQKAKENLGRLVPLWVVEFSVDDLGDLPLEDRFADAVVEDMILHHCPRPRRAIAELVRVLKKVGRLVVADLDRHDDR
jgi:ubiquinone/menaquinone biosynthesis C-methylase UbiE